MSTVPGAPEVLLSAIQVERPRKRSRTIRIKKTDIADRIEKFYTQDNEERRGEIDARIQRYAKFRGWTEGKDWPWEGATDFPNPDMMSASMRLQDTLHNAAMAQRPAITATATKKADKDKEEGANALLDFQFFEEQPGEKIVGELAEDFVNDGLFTAYIPWVDESRAIHEVKIFDPIPAEMSALEYFTKIVEGLFDKGSKLKVSSDGFDWKITSKKKKRAQVSFFTNDEGMVEGDIDREVQVYNGPRVFRKDLQEVLHPIRCENLQIKGPSNPLGASHVILKDFPSIDEIKRLVKSSFYDLVSKDEKKKLGLLEMIEENQEREQQKDVLSGGGSDQKPPKGAESHGTLTRLMCFDTFDINDDGIDEDVVFWMILENKIVLRARHLTQMFPSSPPRRPFAEGQLFPVPGRRYAIGILEMMEGLHDLETQFMNQAGDAGTMANAPFGFYRPTSSMRPEQIRLWPGEMYALADPQKDVNFPQFGNKDQTFAFNVITILQQAKERLTTIGDLQLGRVPQGKASALRTVSGIQTVLGQGDARPERVLRRFFLGLKEIFQQMHSLNKTFLPKEKQFRITGYTEPAKDPYVNIKKPNDIQGEFTYTFSANALNTSKEATQQALQGLMATYVTPLAIQMGITDQDGAYRLMRDFGKSLGQDPDKYIKAPSPQALQIPIFAGEAIAAIMDGDLPGGVPAEGAINHLSLLQEFVTNREEFGLITNPEILELFKQYLQKIAALAQQQKNEQALLQAAQQFGNENGAPPGTGVQPGSEPRESQEPLGKGELKDETLPGAGGGGNTGPA